MAAVYSTKGKDVLRDGQVVSTASTPEMAVTMAQNSAKKLGGTYATASVTPVKTTAPAATTKTTTTTSTKTAAAQRAQDQEAAAYKAAGVEQPVSATVAPVATPAASAPPSGATLISGPSGLAGLTESQLWRDPNSSKVYKLATTAAAQSPAATAPVVAPAATAPTTGLNTTGLAEAQARLDAGTANATDKANLEYAKSKGWTPTGMTTPASGAAGAATGTTEGQGQSYTIQSGDTLSKIAAANGTTVDELMRLNPQITNPNQIYAGKAITLPGAKTNADGSPDLSTISTVQDANAAINADQDADIASKSVSDEPPTRKTTDEIMADITKSVTPVTPAPEAPNTEASLAARREEYGVNDLETQLNDLNAQAAEIDAAKRARIADERAKPVATNVISGRVSEAERQENERIDALNRQITSISNQLTTKYGIIDTLMAAESTDYATASAAYDKQFAQNVQIYNAAKGIEETAKTDAERAADNARSNAQIILNTMSAQNQSYADLSPTQQATLTKLGLESGLGADFFKNVAASSGNKEILTTIKSDDESKVSVVYKDGTTAVFSTGITNKTGSTSNSNSTPKPSVSEAVAAIKADNEANGVYGEDGKISWEDYLYMYQTWLSNGYTAQTFDANFPIGQYLDSNNQFEFKQNLGK